MKLNATATPQTVSVTNSLIWKEFRLMPTFSPARVKIDRNPLAAWSGKVVSSVGDCYIKNECARWNCFFIRTHPSKSFNLRCREPSFRPSTVLWRANKENTLDSWARASLLREWCLLRLFSSLHSHFPPSSLYLHWKYTRTGIHFYWRDKIWTLFRHTRRLRICRVVWEILHLIRDCCLRG